MMAFEWTTENCRLLIRLWQERKTCRQIAAEMGCEPKDVNQKIVHLRRKGVSLDRRWVRSNLDYKALARYAREVSRAA